LWLQLNTIQLVTCRHSTKSAQVPTWVLFSSEKISNFDTVAFLFLFDKYYPIITN
jgi:hypothetical protein